MSSTVQTLTFKRHLKSNFYRTLFYRALFGRLEEHQQVQIPIGIPIGMIPAAGIHA